MTTAGELLRKGRTLFMKAALPSPGLDASLLLARLLGESREKTIIHDERIIGDETARRFDAALERRLSGESVAGITGRKEFWGLDFEVGEGVLIPRPETELLVECALAWLGERPSARVLDLCTGSGIVAVALKRERPGLEVHASDLSPEALDWAGKNVRTLLGEGAVSLYRGDLFDAGALPKEFDLVCANPPYVKSGEIKNLPPEVRKDPVMALDGGEDGLSLITRIIARGKKRIKKNGRLFMEADPGQMPAIGDLLERHAYTRIEITRDLAGQDRIIGASVPA